MIKTIYPAITSCFFGITRTTQTTIFREEKDVNVPQFVGSIYHEFDGQNNLLSVAFTFSVPMDVVTLSFHESMEQIETIANGDPLIRFGVHFGNRRTYIFMMTPENAGSFGPILRLLSEASEEIYHEMFLIHQEIYYGSVPSAL